MPCEDDSQEPSGCSSPHAQLFVWTAHLLLVQRLSCLMPHFLKPPGVFRREAAMLTHD